MTGKSRMLKELAQNNFFTVSICLRTKSLNMQPPRTSHVADLLSSKTHTLPALERMTCLVSTYLTEFAEWVKETVPEKLTFDTWSQHQKDVVDARVGEALSQALQKMSYKPGFPDRLSISKKLDPYVKTKSLDILFVFDEARELLEYTDAKKINLFRCVI
jgi:hypothetical protein